MSKSRVEFEEWITKSKKNRNNISLKYDETNQRYFDCMVQIAWETWVYKEEQYYGVDYEPIPIISSRYNENYDTDGNVFYSIN